MKTQKSSEQILALPFKSVTGKDARAEESRTEILLPKLQTVLDFVEKNK